MVVEVINTSSCEVTTYSGKWQETSVYGCQNIFLSYVWECMTDTRTFTRNAGLKAILKQTSCLNVRPTDKYRMLEKGKWTKATKQHIWNDDDDLRSHMPCKGKVLTFNIGAAKHFWWKWSSTERDAQRKTLARRCMSEKCQSQIKLREAAGRAYYGEQPRGNPVLGRRDSRQAAQTTPGHPQSKLPTASLVHGLWNFVPRAPRCRLQEKCPAHVCETESFEARSGLLLTLQRLLCWCLWGSKTWKLPSGMHQIELGRC